jgi:hypothetical protein
MAMMFYSNMASKFLLSYMVTVQVAPLPRQLPLQPTKVDPVDGFAVNVTLVYLLNAFEQA